MEFRLISAEQLEAKCNDMMDSDWNHKVAPASWATAYERFKEDIEDMPTIDPFTHGYWNERYECSECGYWNRDIFAPTPNYCARCGAKMDAKTE